jgi:hypothetical protein
MKCRSLLLIALMVVVPALAMFSHHLPAGLSTTASRLLLAPVITWVASWGEAAGSGPTPRITRAESLADGDSVPTAPQAITDADHAAVRDGLRTAGVVGVECRHLPGAEAGHVATGRVALDADGQLQRVFQASGHDSLAAERRLLEEVTAWQARRPRPE